MMNAVSQFLIERHDQGLEERAPPTQFLSNNTVVPRDVSPRATQKKLLQKSTMSRKKTDEFNFVGLARSPPRAGAKHTIPNTTEPNTGYYYNSRLSSHKRGSSAIEAQTPSTIPVVHTASRNTTGNRGSHQRRHALRPVVTNTDFDSSQQKLLLQQQQLQQQQQSPKTAPPAPQLAVCPESANRSTLLMARALRLSPPATENKTALSTINNEPRAHLFEADQSPVLPSRVDRVESPSIIAAGSGPRTARSADPRATMMSPPSGHSTRSPVPAFTPGFEDPIDGASSNGGRVDVHQPVTPEMPDPYLSSADIMSENGSHWSDITSSVDGVFSPDPPTPMMPATARRVRAKKMALLSATSKDRDDPVAAESVAANGKLDIGVVKVGATPPLPRVMASGSSPGSGKPVTADTPAAMSALLAMVGGSSAVFSERVNFGASAQQAAKPVVPEAGIVPVDEGDPVREDDTAEEKGNEGDTHEHDVSNTSIDTQVLCENV